jgi:GNAT superfamily N-acetyltransferase
VKSAKRHRNIIQRFTKGVYYLAEIDGAVVGQLMNTYEWSDWRNATFWWIQSVYVHPEHRKHGDLRLYVDDTNKRAQKTYEALGMKQSHYKMMKVNFVV